MRGGGDLSPCHRFLGGTRGGSPERAVTQRKKVVTKHFRWVLCSPPALGGW